MKTLKTDLVPFVVNDAYEGHYIVKELEKFKNITNSENWYGSANQNIGLDVNYNIRYATETPMNGVKKITLEQFKELINQQEKQELNNYPLY